jgi:BMFP domain-containing protein YqiC
MVVSKTEFNAALVQINESYAALVARIQKLEEAQAENEKPKRTTRKAAGASDE